MRLVKAHAALKDAQGHRLVVRNGHLPGRSIQTGVGLVDVRQPRVHGGWLDEQGQPIRFSSKILPHPDLPYGWLRMDDIYTLRVIAHGSQWTIERVLKMKIAFSH